MSGLFVAENIGPILAENFEPELMQPFATAFKYWYNVYESTTMYRCISSLVFGMLLSPYGSGLFYLILFVLLGELITYIYNRHHLTLFDRLVVIMSSIFGYIIGRTVIGYEVDV